MHLTPRIYPRVMVRNKKCWFNLPFESNGQTIKVETDILQLPTFQRNYNYVYEAKRDENKANEENPIDFL